MHPSPECLVEQAGLALQDNAWIASDLENTINQLCKLQKDYPSPDKEKEVGNEHVHYCNSGAIITIKKTPYGTAVVSVSSSSYGDLSSSLTFQIDKDVSTKLMKFGASFIKAASHFESTEKGK